MEQSSAKNTRAVGHAVFEEATPLKEKHQESVFIHVQFMHCLNHVFIPSLVKIGKAKQYKQHVACQTENLNGFQNFFDAASQNTGTISCKIVQDHTF